MFADETTEGVSGRRPVERNFYRRTGRRKAFPVYLKTQTYQHGLCTLLGIGAGGQTGTKVAFQMFFPGEDSSAVTATQRDPTAIHQAAAEETCGRNQGRCCVYKVPPSKAQFGRLEMVRRNPCRRMVLGIK